MPFLHPLTKSYFHMKVHPWKIKLSHWARVTHICVGKTSQLCFRYWLVAWNIVNLNLMNKIQWIPKWNSYIFIQENAYENVVCEMAAILPRPQCVKPALGDQVMITLPAPMINQLIHTYTCYQVSTYQEWRCKQILCVKLVCKFKRLWEE